MLDSKCIFVEKRNGFNIEAKELLQDFKKNLKIDSLNDVRVINKYIIKGTSNENYKKSINSIFSEPNVDIVYEDNLQLNDKEKAFAVEYLQGQYDQRADSAMECFKLLTGEEDIFIKSSKVIVLTGEISEKDFKNIKTYYINPVDSMEAYVNSKEILSYFRENRKIEILKEFINNQEEDLEKFHKENGLAMTLEDLKMIRDYFKYEEKRDPKITEIKVIDTYWSDHCRHTTFSTTIEEVVIEDGIYNRPLKESYENYKKSRAYVYEDNLRDINLMDIAVITMKEMRKKGLLEDLDVSDEINACSINVDVETDKGILKYLLMFKNETHNHPTEIEPFGGAATCLGGAIRDPLSGRTYVYQAMRVTGAGDVTKRVDETIDGKLPQRTITLKAANGYSSYGNQIGLATGQVTEVYHNNYEAKRMEVGAVIGAAPKENVLRSEPKASDIVILLGGRTGRDGIGGATGSSKEHNVDSINQCGAEVQKGNAPTERKIQRLFRNKNVSRMIKRCNDFGAGGVSVAIGELCDGLDIDLDKVLKKYEGLDGTEIAISESQERMAVVVSRENAKEFIKLSNKENLEAVVVAKVTNLNRLRMYFENEKIVDIDRNFLNTNGAAQKTKVYVKEPNKDFFNNNDIDIKNRDLKEIWIDKLKDLNISSQKGLVERFDSTIGSGTILMPFGGKYQNTPAEGMACKIPVLNANSLDASIMTFGFNPNIGMWSPFHMAFYSVVEAVTKLSAMGGDYKKAKLTLQEYFEKLGKDETRWGKPFAALLGAYKAQIDLGIPAIGGKDSMSGSFNDIDVPPSLVAFAVTTEKIDNIISPEFKKSSSKVLLLDTKKLEDRTIDMDEFKKNLDNLHRLIKEKKVISAWSAKFGGILEGLSKMSLGNKIGVEFDNISKEELVSLNYGSVVLEVEKDTDINHEFRDCNYKLIGKTLNYPVIKSKELDLEISLDEIGKVLEEKLSDVFKIKIQDKDEKVPTRLMQDETYKKSSIKVAKPRVVIPVFPGTNCEYDCKRAFEKEGAEANEVIFRNLTRKDLEESINDLEKEIRRSQIIMIPGGFSAGDEPDGSGKFIANLFRNKKIKDAVMDLLKNRDGLILGICNGFQALIKLGLVPYGEILDIKQDMPTLTYNEVNRHMSSIVSTKIVSKKSPWFNEVNLGDIHKIPISHGEGRFVASRSFIDELIKNGQVATQYVDLNGEVAVNMPFNPNGSMLGIEGITSFDGRVLGKMGHSERVGDGLYKNIPGEFDQKIFRSGVNYFK